MVDQRAIVSYRRIPLREFKLELAWMAASAAMTLKREQRLLPLPIIMVKTAQRSSHAEPRRGDFGHDASRPSFTVMAAQAAIHGWSTSALLFLIGAIRCESLNLNWRGRPPLRP